MAKTQTEKDIEAVEEVLGWDPRGSDAEYRYVARAQKAFERIKEKLSKLPKEEA